MPSKVTSHYTLSRLLVRLTQMTLGARQLRESLWGRVGGGECGGRSGQHGNCRGECL